MMSALSSSLMSVFALPNVMSWAFTAALRSSMTNSSAFFALSSNSMNKVVIGVRRDTCFFDF